MLRFLYYMLMEGEGAAIDGGGGAPPPAAPPAPGGSLLSGGEVVPPPPAAGTPPPPGTPPTPLSVVFPDNWKEGISEDMRNHPALGHVADIPTLVKNYISAQTMVGADKVQVPGKHATPEDWTTFYHKTGLPQSLETYEVKLPEGAEFNDGFVSQLKEQAFLAGVKPDQLNPILAWYDKANKEAVTLMETESQQKRDEEVKALKFEWGQAFDQKLQQAKAAAKATGIPDLFSWLDDSGLGDDPRMIKMLSAFGEMLGEDKIVGGDGSQAQTPGSMQKDLDTILSDKTHPYWNRDHMGHTTAKKEVEAMFAKLHPVKL